MAKINTAATKATKPASNAALVKKALAMSTKSDGMRLLLEAGYTVTNVKSIFGAPYGFVYGVAKRAGLAETAAARRPIKAKAPARVAKATKPAAKVVKTASKTTPVAIKARATGTSAAAKVAAKIKGRPSPARRAANRKSPATA